MTSEMNTINQLTNYVFMISLKIKTTEDVNNAYLKQVYSNIGGSKYILCDRVENVQANNVHG